jgi:hypothetical protein
VKGNTPVFVITASVMLKYIGYQVIHIFVIYVVFNRIGETRLNEFMLVHVVELLGNVNYVE